MNLFYKIGEFAKLCGVTVKTLRHYEAQGLLIPAQVDDWTGYRYYHVGQQQRMESIRNLKAAGLSLDEIGELLSSDSQVLNPSMLLNKIAATESQIRQLVDRKQRLIAMAESRKELQEMNDITFQSLPSITVACHRATIQSYNQLGELCCNIIGPEMARLGCQCPEPGYCFTWETDHEYRDHDINIEYCEKVSQALPDSDLIKFRTLEAVQTAVCFKVYGPYDKLRQAYLDLFAYIEKEHYHIIGAPRACYVDGIWNQSDPDKWLTIIQVPVEKAGPIRQPLNRLRIFCCPSCGNVTFAYGKGMLHCCNQHLDAMKVTPANDDERYAATEMDGECLLTFESPMTKDDYIAAVVVERHESTTLYRLFPEQAAQVRIATLAGSTVYTVRRHDGNTWLTKQ